MILHGDCLTRFKEMADNSIDAVVTDPPYGLRFMGKKWDYDVPKAEVWTECLRVLKPGGHLLSFGGTRTYHRMVIAIEDAGFEIRDQIQWLYGSGFPKSHSIDKAIDKMHGAEREVVGLGVKAGNMRGGNLIKGAPKTLEQFYETAPATPDAIKWAGWGTALKPANEPIVLARKPLEGTVAQNVLKHGVGGLNIDASRIAGDLEQRTRHNGGGRKDENVGAMGVNESVFSAPANTQGRWPANVIMDECAAEMLDEQSGQLKSGALLPGHKQSGHGDKYSYRADAIIQKPYGGDTGGASRFFYVAKASKRERNAGCEGMAEREKKTLNDYVSPSEGRTASKSGAPMANHHPTVKPIKLMEYLIRLICPPGGLVLDPFCGSGSTGVAARKLGFEFIGIEMNEEYVAIARRRIEAVL